MQDDEDEYELDIDALDPETCWKLQAYVDGVLAEQAAKQPGQAPPPAAPPAAGGAPAAAAAGAPVAGGPAAPAGGPAAAAPAAPAAQQPAGAPAADGAPHRSSGEPHPAWLASAICVCRLSDCATSELLEIVQQAPRLAPPEPLACTRYLAGSDSDEGVGSKGGAGSTLADQAAEVKQSNSPLHAPADVPPAALPAAAPQPAAAAAPSAGQ